MTTKHVVVDGSNIATEGRSMPSLQQLDEAVNAFLAAHPHDRLTVVVDATFGHRIDDAERTMFEEAVSAGELISPPAGAVGRGDAFVLEIADRAGATVLSNDSFQEFHGQYTWLFDSGRLIGGKPVPDVGWVFLERIPVRGPASRKSVQAAKKARRQGPGEPSRSAREPSRGKGGKGDKRKQAEPKAAKSTTKAGKKKAGSAAGGGRAKQARRGGDGKPPEPVNDPLTFIEFVASHPVGSLVAGTVDQFASHGAYVVASGARCYLPLKAMGNPPPRAARDVLKVGEVRDFVVTSIDTPRRGLDLALPDDDAPRAAEKKTATSGALVDRNSGALHTAEEAPVTPAKRTTRKKAPAKRKAAARKKAPAKRKATAKRKAPAKRKSAAKRKAPAKRKKAPAKRKKAPAKRKKAPAKRKKAPAKRKKAPAKRKKAPAKRKKAPAKRKKAPAKRKKAPAKRKKAPAKRKKAPAKRKKAPARRKKAPARRR
jgi:hypothetical protein